MGKMKLKKVFFPENGVTLVEIIASIVLLGLVISILIPIFPQMIRWSNASEKELVGSNLIARVAQDIADDEGSMLSSESKNLPLQSCYPKMQDTYQKINIAIKENTYKKDETNGKYYLKLNGDRYFVDLEGCKDSIEFTNYGLIRFHFTITNDKTNRKVDAYAYLQKGEDL